jgi:hypothetical protein
VADLAIISAGYGGYDPPKPALTQAGIDAEYVFVTDSPELYAEYEFLRRNPAYAYGITQWRVVYDPRPGETPVRAAKHAKFFPWEYTDAPESIWIDGSIRIISQTFAAEAIAFADPIAQADHPRNCLYAEANASWGTRKYISEPVLAQASHYRSLGHPAEWGLWAGGIIARKHTAQVKDLSSAWDKEVRDWSFQDQVSEPFALRTTGLRPSLFHVFPGYPWTQTERTGKHRDSGYTWVADASMVEGYDVIARTSGREWPDEAMFRNLRLLQRK